MVADPRVSFVISTVGSRAHITRTLESLNAVGTELPDYEIVVVGNVERVDAEDNDRLRLVPELITDWKFKPRFVWQKGVLAARHPWVAFVADDMLLPAGWGAVFRRVQAPTAQVIYGALTYPDGSALDPQRIIRASICAAVNRDLLGKFPMQEFYGEDGYWNEQIHRAKTPFTYCPDLKWLALGQPAFEGTLPPTYIHDNSHRAAYNAARKAAGWKRGYWNDMVWPNVFQHFTRDRPSPQRAPMPR